MIENDHVEPKTPLPYYEVMDNLIADHRTNEAVEYLAVYKTLPAHKPFLVPIYQASIALAEYDKPNLNKSPRGMGIYEEYSPTIPHMINLGGLY